MLQRKGVEMVGERWRDMFKLLVFDANMDIRDTLREMVWNTNVTQHLSVLLVRELFSTPQIPK